jgi:hypothetical protein
MECLEQRERTLKGDQLYILTQFQSLVVIAVHRIHLTLTLP